MESKPMVCVAAAWAWLGLAPAAHADWGYTRWGMSPEQVVAASGGSARLLAPAQRTRDDPDGWEISVEGSAKDNDMVLQTGFMFDTHGAGLRCVLYNATGTAAEKLRDGMMARHGRPHSDTNFGPARTLVWHTPDSVELTVNTKPLAAVVSHCRPGDGGT